MKATRVVAALALVALTSGAAQAQFVRCSWNSCDPQVVNQSFAGPGVYNLVVSMSGADAPNVGTEVNVLLFPAIPDAWRFDDSGCQTPSQILFNSNAFSKTCPAMRGTNPLPITHFGYNEGVGTIRLFQAYDTFDPDPSSRYTLWTIAFDHTYSQAGPGEPGYCGGADAPVSIAVGRVEYAQEDGQKIIAQTAPGDVNPCLWNQSVVPTQSTTLGRVKSQYR